MHAIAKVPFVAIWSLKLVQLCRVEKLRRQFGHLYVVVSVPTREQNDSFNSSYFK